LVSVEKGVVAAHASAVCGSNYVGQVGLVEGVSQISTGLHGVQISSKGSALSLAGLHSTWKRVKLVSKGLELREKLVTKVTKVVVGDSTRAFGFSHCSQLKIVFSPTLGE